MNLLLCADGAVGRAGRAGRVGRALVAMAVGPLVLAGCAPSTDEVRAETRSSKQHVTAQSREVLEPLAAVGTFAFAYGRWSGCGDFGGKVLYEVSGRIDPAPGDVGPLVERVVDRVAAAGVRLRRTSRQDADTVTFAAVREGVIMEFYGYEQDPYVLFYIIGPCLDVDDLDRKLLDARRTPFDPGES